MARNGGTRLELTWIGKNERPRLEPRILIEDAQLSHHAATKRDGDVFDNMLIQGDNLLALKALEATHTEAVQAIYIDPPFNTGEAFEHYDDGVEHSIWLTLMYQRIRMLHKLLSKTGTMFVHIDDNELGYLITIIDEVFGRSNRISVSTFKQSSVSGPKSRNPGVVSIANFVLIYAKDKKYWKNHNVYRPIKRDSRYGQFVQNFDEDISEWRFVPLSQGIEEIEGLPFKKWEEKAGRNFEQRMEEFVLQERRRVVQLVSVADKDVNSDARDVLNQSRNTDSVLRSPRDQADDYYFYRGKQVAFYASKVREIDGRLTTVERVSNIWDDLLSNNVHKEGGVRLPNGKKPESLIRRCLHLSTDPGDLVLDSFLGSGTTAAAAHKMRRRWIGIEMGDQAVTHCMPRLRRLVDGEDPDGISQAERWQGGGGFRFYNLAPSLLEKDKWGNWVIAKTYNAAMLAEAMCRHMGFVYAPSQEVAEYWKHGHSSERDFIFITTASLTHDQLKAMSHDVGPERTLLICCKAFNARPDAFDNLTVQKIPHAILNRCEWGRDDYSLAIADLPPREPADDVRDGAAEHAAPARRGRAKSAPSGPSLFDDGAT